MAADKTRIARLTTSAEAAGSRGKVRDAAPSGTHRTVSTDVAIIGAGPYGLSLAAHLRALGVEHRLIGRPMETWLTQMPKGMLLKSEGFASNLSDRDRKFTLAQFCKEHGTEYADVGLPVDLATFCAYGLAFQERCAPHLENKLLHSIDRCSQGFTLTLDDGESFTARRVVLALGISYFSHLPSELAHLPPDFLTHSSAHPDPGQMKGRDVVVIGAGASAIDLAALLHESGANVRLIARRPELEIHTPMRLPRPLRDRIRAPLTGIGPNWRSWWYCNAPLLFHALPVEKRFRIASGHLGPAAGYFMRDRFVGKVPSLLGFRVHSAELSNDRVQLALVAGDGTRQRVEAEHVICATGYTVDLRRIAPLAEALRAQIQSVKQTPLLTSNFESSVPHLYFVGPAAVNSFGPLMRFAFGAEYAARRVSNHLARTAVKQRNWSAVPLQQSATIGEAISD